MSAELDIKEELDPELKERINWDHVEKWAEHITPERAKKAAVEAYTWQNHAESLARRYAKLHKDRHNILVSAKAWRATAQRVYQDIHGPFATGLKRVYDEEKAKADREHPYDGPKNGR